MSRKARPEADADQVASGLDQHWPDARCELLYHDNWQLLVAAILSARATDERVNQVMAVLNEHYAGPEAFEHVSPRELASVIRRLPLYQQKARAVVEAARCVLHTYDGQVPAARDQLMALPGVGRKVAAVVLGNGFDVPSVAADVHVQRIVHRLGWTQRVDPLEAERAIEDRFKAATWVRRCHQFIRVGRDCCRPMRPWCSKCPLATTCPQCHVDDAR